ncbi:MAG TPA: class I SAM-dependent methyltransferase [Candidatus Acidoferrum sp.]|jgi:2-polyprenyl-3-methyl-5-hydroxy-6-metoxy-1,4-benzoquinol methylase|nr:class I SAM-dependent methyltransferase [Candidatus Acidoferrum sp.]
MRKPHSSWAHCYDFVYENSYGNLYGRFTDLTLAALKKLAPGPCSVVDFGAGTGRLSIPLAKMGYAVTAVEPCPEMMQVLEAKANLEGVRIESRTQKMQDFDAEARFDVALCVFTTLSYLLDKDTLEQALTRLARSLKKKGKLLIDITSHDAFQGYRKQTDLLERIVQILPAGGDLYSYHEKTRYRMNGHWKECKDAFSIRYWPAASVLSVLKANGIKCEGPIKGFQKTGAEYYSGTKTR